MSTQVKSRIPFISGNWKMNMDHLQAIAFVQKLGWTLKDAGHNFSDVEVVVFPPFTDLRSVQTLVDADEIGIKYGAQNLSEHLSGAYTGEISASFLAALRCSYVLIGHSERRTLYAEQDEVLAAKVAIALEHQVTPVLCVGETADDLEKYGASTVPVEQLKKALTKVSTSQEIVIAYEPVWAIGSGKAASAQQAQEVSYVLRDTLAKERGEDIAQTTRILYGGSVKASNVAGYLAQPDVDGALVGGASLEIKEFSDIVRFQSHETV